MGAGQAGRASQKTLWIRPCTLGYAIHGFAHFWLALPAYST